MTAFKPKTVIRIKSKSIENGIERWEKEFMVIICLLRKVLI